MKSRYKIDARKSDAKRMENDTKMHPKWEPNSKLPMFTGKVTVNEKELSIALWRQEKYGKESFSIQFTREDEG